MNRGTDQHEELSAYLDGELTDAEAAELEAELARDSELRHELAALEEAVVWLRREGPDEAPLGFHRRVMDRIEAEHPRSTAWWAWLRRPLGLRPEGWLVAAAVAAVLLFAVLRAPKEAPPPEWPGPPPPGSTERANPAVVGGLEDLELPDEPTDAADEGTAEAVPPPRKDAPAPRKRLFEPEPSLEVPPPATKRAPSKPSEGAAAGPEQGPASEGGTDDPPDPAASPEAPQVLAPQPAGYRVTVRSTDPALKGKVLRVAARYTDLITDLRGQDIEQSAMAGPEESLVVWLPQDQLTDFRRDLGSLGFMVASEGDQELVGGGPMAVRVLLQQVEPAPAEGTAD